MRSKLWLGLEHSAPDVVIRTATLEDAAALAEIHVSAWCAAYRGHMPDSVLDGLSVEQRTADWQQWLKQPGPVTTLVVESHAELRAFCVFGPSRDDDAQEQPVGEILALNVHPKFWRCGYGAALCKTVLGTAQQRQWTAITLWMLASNRRADSFYRVLDFIPDGAERLDTSIAGVTISETRYRRELS